MRDLLITGLTGALLLAPSLPDPASAQAPGVEIEAGLGAPRHPLDPWWIRPE